MLEIARVKRGFTLDEMAKQMEIGLLLGSFGGNFFLKVGPVPKLPQLLPHCAQYSTDLLRLVRANL